jgi:hypothetical protein
LSAKSLLQRIVLSAAQILLGDGAFALSRRQAPVRGAISRQTA